jgi:hypothetical protein
MIDQQAEFQGFPATQRETTSESAMQRFLRLSEGARTARAPGLAA